MIMFSLCSWQSAASLYTMRTISMMSTQLPSGYADNYSRCRPIVDKPAFTILVQRTLQQFIQLGFQVNISVIIKFGHITDTDLMT